MSLDELVALLRRHMIAAMVVVVLAVGAAYTFKRTPLTYGESATMILTVPKSLANPNPYATFDEPLITTSGVVALSMMGAQSLQKVRAAGAVGTYNVALVNLYNEQYPNYGEPSVTVTATAHDPAAAHNTFAIVIRLFQDNLAARQAQQGVPPHDRIGAHEAGDTGPMLASGSRKRVFAGLTVLTIVAVFSVCIFLDRHPVLLRDLMRFPAARHRRRRRQAASVFATVQPTRPVTNALSATKIQAQVKIGIWISDNGSCTAQAPS